MAEGVGGLILGTVAAEALTRFVDEILNKRSSFIDQTELKNSIKEQLEIEKKRFVSNNSDINFDFEAAADTILDALFKEKTLENLLSEDKERQNREIERICKLCNQEAYSKDSTSDKWIKDIVINCLNVVDKHFYKKIPQEYLELLKRGVDEVNRNTKEVADEVTIKINNRITSESRSLNQKFDNLESLVEQFLANQNSAGTVPYKEIYSDNKQYWDMFRTSPFLDKDNPNITLDKMFIEPLVSDGSKIFDYLYNWYNSNNRFLMLYGEAGSGKSSLVAKLIDQLYTGGDYNDLPVLAVALRDHCDLFGDLPDDYSAKDVISKLYNVPNIDFLENKILILDGFDELTVLVSGFDKTAAAVFIEKLYISIKNSSNSIRVIITSREGYFNLEEDTFITETLSWGEEQVDEWCHIYGSLKLEVKTWCQDFPTQYKNLLCNDEVDYRKKALCVPFILYLCCNSQVDLLNNRTLCQVYDQAFRNLLLRKHSELLTGAERFYSNISEENQRIAFWQFTKEIAYQMFLTDKLDLSSDYGLENAKSRTVKILNDQYSIAIDKADLQLAEYISVFSFANQSNNQGVTFAHKTVYEYFTAVKIYEDYFEDFGNYSSAELSEETAVKNTFNKIIEAFRYHNITPDIFQYLNEMKLEAFRGKDLSNKLKFNSARFVEFVVKALQEGYLSNVIISEPVYEYAIDKKSMIIHKQITRTFRSLICFLSGHGFTNENNVKMNWVNDTLLPSDQYVDLRNWNLEYSDLSGAYLVKANISGANLLAATLGNADLTDANLSEANLERVFLMGARLAGADLSESKMKMANCSCANLEGADLIFVKMQSSILTNAKITNAKLASANLSDSILKDTDLNYSILTRINLTRADLTDARLLKADLTNATLTWVSADNAWFYKADLSYSNMTCASLIGADFSRAKLTYTKLINANLTNACFRDADLTGADLSGAIIKGADFSGANLVDAIMPE